MSVIVAGVVIVLAAVLLLASGGQHGPGQHTSSGGAPTSGITQPPALGGAAVPTGTRT